MSKLSVAVIGLNGSLGAPTLEAFQSPVFKDHFSFPIRALTRDPASKVASENSENSENIQYIQYIACDLDGDQQILLNQLKGVDVFVSLIKSTTETLAKLERLVVALRPRLYIPSRFGCDIAQVNSYLPSFAQTKAKHSEKMREAGIRVVDITNSFFAGGPWLYEIVCHVGIDTETQCITYLGSPQTPISFTNLKDVARTIVAVASKANQDLPPSIKVESGKVTPEQVAQRYEETHDVKLTVKAIIDKEEVLQEAQRDWDPTDYRRFIYWLNVLVSQGMDKGACFSSNDNELVNPGQTLWQWEKF